VRVWADRFEDRRDSPFKRFTLRRGGHLAFQADGPCESGERPPMTEPYSDDGVDKLVGQNASDTHRIIQDGRNHDLDMAIGACLTRPAFTHPLQL